MREGFRDIVINRRGGVNKRLSGSLFLGRGGEIAASGYDGFAVDGPTDDKSPPNPAEPRYETYKFFIMLLETITDSKGSISIPPSVIILRMIHLPAVQIAQEVFAYSTPLRPGQSLFRPCIFR